MVSWSRVVVCLWYENENTSGCPGGEEGGSWETNAESLSKANGGRMCNSCLTTSDNKAPANNHEENHFLKEPCTLFHFWHTAYREVLYFVVITASYGSDIHHRCVPSVVNGSAVMDLHRSRSCATLIQSLFGTIFRYIESSATHWK